MLWTNLLGDRVDGIVRGCGGVVVFGLSGWGELRRMSEDGLGGLGWSLGAGGPAVSVCGCCFGGSSPKGAHPRGGAVGGRR